MRASPNDEAFMRRALQLAKKGHTSPNPMVGAVLVKNGLVLGEGYHHRAGEPHAEIEALRAAAVKGMMSKGATLYVTLEPCCTSGRTPPCTEAIIRAGIRNVVVAATDPNPKHSGHGFAVLRRKGIRVSTGVLEREATELNAAFNHWIVNGRPLATVKSAMTLDGKIATAQGESKWITGEKARMAGMRLRAMSDAILVGVNTVISDDPSLTVRTPRGEDSGAPRLRRIVLDSRGRTPLSSRLVTDSLAHLTTIVVTRAARATSREALAKRVQVLVAPAREGRVDLAWLADRLGQQEVTSLLVEGGGEVNASFLFGGHAQRVAFFYAPKILGGRLAKKGVAGAGALHTEDALKLKNVAWKKIGEDWFLQASLA
ncbi:MAG TPA: bifunctional diaminohydroxyphosphoribosylaminopyrimidine deaminase/5-amino-6-(5-phosphoribosylamino)uracil reductase RibD [Candidatus Saccharimonadales bacterium]|nr:bifunctional diaminohydroxyphosphoribosylaminopyrimidine deaminase/5-amino-6-(5-phosphoribosylamino)uracil reductase RibD [Candidatus Saccharimonadales bacterium]